MRPVPRKDRKCGSEEAERFASAIVVGQVSERVRIRTPRGREVGDGDIHSLEINQVRRQRWDGDRG